MYSRVMLSVFVAVFCVAQGMSAEEYRPPSTGEGETAYQDSVTTKGAGTKEDAVIEEHQWGSVSPFIQYYIYSSGTDFDLTAGQSLALTEISTSLMLATGSSITFHCTIEINGSVVAEWDEAVTGSTYVLLRQQLPSFPKYRRW